MAFKFVRCPCCGRCAPPAALEMEHVLELIEVKGLGRGRGFQNNRKSVERDSTWVAAFVKILWKQLERVKRKAKALGVNLEELGVEVAEVLDGKPEDLTLEVKPCAFVPVSSRGLVPARKRLSLVGMSSGFYAKTKRAAILSFAPVRLGVPTGILRSSANA